MWLNRPDFLNVVSSSWQEPIAGYGMLRFSLKLRRLKQALCLWNKEKFGNIFDNLRRSEATLKRMEQQFDSSGSAEDLVALTLPTATILLLYWLV